MARASVSLSPLTPRGLCREDAARYLSIGATLFDRMVQDGRMPRAKRLDGRKVWDVRALDRAFEDLPADGENVNPWDYV